MPLSSFTIESPPLAPALYQQQLPADLPTPPQNRNCEGKASPYDQEISKST